MDTRETRAAVAKGATYCDQEYPGWAFNINTVDFDMMSPWHCIGGQLSKSGYIGFTRKGAGCSSDWAEGNLVAYRWSLEHGFTTETQCFSTLTNMWLEEINQRKADN